MRRLPLLVLASLLCVAALATTATAAGFTGAWTKSISSGPAQLKGRWTLHAAGGKFWIQKGSSSTHLVDGTATVSGTTLTFTDKKGPLHCTGATAVGKYRKVAAGKGFKLTAIKDGCAGRRLIMTTGAWAVAQG